jgi:hypothetical protein
MSTYSDENGEHSGCICPGMLERDGAETVEQLGETDGVRHDVGKREREERTAKKKTWKRVKNTKDPFIGRVETRYP